MATFSHDIGVARDVKIVSTTHVYGSGGNISSNSSRAHNVRIEWKNGTQSTLNLRGEYSVGDVVALVARNKTYVAEYNLTTNARIDYRDTLTMIVRFTGPGCLPTLVAVAGAMLIPFSEQVKNYGIAYPDNPLAPYGQIMLIGGVVLTVAGLLWYLSVHGSIRSAIDRQIAAARASAGT